MDNFRQIVLEIPDEVYETPVTDNELRIIMMDAFSEYCSHRAGNYVDTRYPEMSEAWREEKKRRISRYKAIANNLKTAVSFSL